MSYLRMFVSLARTFMPGGVVLFAMLLRRPMRMRR